MYNPHNLSALVGLAGAIGNNGKLDTTDKLVLEAILSQDSEEITEKIHNERNSISPSCQFCESPCGNTSDYNLAKLDNAPENIHALKEEVWEALRGWIAKVPADQELPEIVYRVISSMAYDLVEDSYKALLQELQ